MGGNVFGNVNGCSGYTADDAVNAAPELSALANNGGETWTHALNETSPAINFCFACTDVAGNIIEMDQRDEARFPYKVFQCDSGAFESNHTPLPALSYVSSDGNCGAKAPCYSKIQDAIDNASTGWAIFVNILVKQGIYAESLNLGSNKTLLIKGGYNDAYDQPTANTTFIQTPGPTTIKASSGSLKFQMINVK